MSAIRESRDQERCSSGPRPLGSAARISTTSSEISALEARALPAGPGSRGGGRHRGRRARVPAAREGRRACRDLAPDLVRALLSVPDRTRQRVRRTSAWSAIHRDGALQERFNVPASQVFPVGDQEPALAAFVEPVSIAMRAVVRGARGRRGEGRRSSARGRSARRSPPLRSNEARPSCSSTRVASRLERGRAIGAEMLAPGGRGGCGAPVREWAGGDGPEVVFEATGVPEVAQTAVELVAQAGRVVVVGLSHTDAPIRVGDLAFKEIDVLGVSCCNARSSPRRCPSSRAGRTRCAGSSRTSSRSPRRPRQSTTRCGHPAEVMKAVIRLEEH